MSFTDRFFLRHDAEPANNQPKNLGVGDKVTLSPKGIEHFKTGGLQNPDIIINGFSGVIIEHDPVQKLYKIQTRKSEMGQATFILNEEFIEIASKKAIGKATGK